ncbi:related to endo-beta-1,4-glucanase [Ramularia collo-cygni]|uniref:Related to endo-beta-1,4-glucanase n=1 Tax=Ramularia collo-cygni TaxID=112498 RepID=A0A2D3V5X9_9PEZI|nr:related to endo-beta-1,4-glucanase [Ramularia collo-cygni]CZT18936.1 related to endo-beta-1,4-glucanase [Ramularia collo-cygni]
MFRKAILLASLLIATVVFYSLHSVPSDQAQFHPTVLEDFENNDTRAAAPLVLAPPLRTSGRYIVDNDGQRVKLASINWYGASDIFHVAGGLDIRHRDEIAATIRSMGFNSVRFPYSDQMVMENRIIPVELIAANLDLLDDYDLKQPHKELHLQKNNDITGPRALDVFNACVESLTKAGLAVIINDHITNAHWCDGFNLCDSSWKNDHLGFCKIKQTTESWIANWQTIMRPFIDNPLVVGADLRNEPRGLWGTMTWNSWATAAEKASEALLEMQPNWLMIVEGTSSANDCSGAKARPVELSLPNRLVYSAHVYSWSGWGSIPSVPYSKRPYESFAKDMHRKWGYLLDNDIAPVWVGEFGTNSDADDQGARHYWESLMKSLTSYDADWGYWALNPRKPENNDIESYGLLMDDWKTPVKDWRLASLQKLMKASKLEGQAMQYIATNLRRI